MELYKKDYINGPLNINGHLSMKIILDPNLVHTFLDSNFFDLNYGEIIEIAHLK